MADDILKEFADFLEAKKASEQEAADSEDFDVEIWDEKGRGVRTKRSHAKPFLQSLGIDLDSSDESVGTDDGNDGDKGDKKGPRSPKNPPASTQSTVRKYFAGKPPVKK